MQLVYCDFAAAKLGYEDLNCETNRTLTWNALSQHEITYDFKFVTQYFNPQRYYHERQMDYWS